MAEIIGSKLNISKEKVTLCYWAFILILHGVFYVYNLVELDFLVKYIFQIHGILGLFRNS